MATVVADPDAPDIDKPSSADAEGAAPAPGRDDGAGAGPERKCANCGKALAPGQDWCLNCGTAVPGALTVRSPGWRSAALVLGATAVLVLAAGAAAYAALTHKNTPGQVTQTVAQAPAPAATPVPVTPATTPTPPPPAPKASVTHPAAAPKLPLTPVKPPKIPLTPVKPPTTSGSGTTTKSTSSTPTQSTTTTTGTTTSQPPILLDTNAASTYNPNHLPEANFGDPSLAIDGDSSTGWTARVEPATAPAVEAGLLINLVDTQRLASVELITPTLGMTVQLFGSAATAVPPTITDPGWTALTKPEVIKTKHVRIKLGHPDTPYRFVTLWIAKAPASAVGTPQAPGRVAVNELELFATIK